MAKKLLVRMYHGFAITMFVDLIVHFVVAQANGSVVTARFASYFRCESAAALAQLALVAVIGMVFALAAVIFEVAKWSYLKQSVLHFLVTAAVWMPIAWLCWSPVHGVGLVFTVLGWTLTYIINWAIQYKLSRLRIAELNQRIQAFRERRENV